MSLPLKLLQLKKQRISQSLARLRNNQAQETNPLRCQILREMERLYLQDAIEVNVEIYRWKLGTMK